MEVYKNLHNSRLNLILITRVKRLSNHVRITSATIPFPACGRVRAIKNENVGTYFDVIRVNEILILLELVIHEF